MRTKKYIKSKSGTKFVKINNSTWIEIDVMIPDEEARLHFLQKMEITRPGTYLGQLKSYISNINT
jgi:hypothetical protein